MKRLNRILLILLCIENTNLELRLSQVEEPSALPDFTINILTNHSEPIQKMAVFFSEHALEVSQIIQGVKAPVLINAEEVPLPKGKEVQEPCGIVLVMEEPSNIARYLNRTVWTADTVFILIMNRKVDSQNQTLLEIFRTFFDANVLNVFVFTTDCKKTSVYTYRPFVFSDCDSIEIIPLDTESKSFALKNQIHDLHQCLLNVSAVDLPPTVIYLDPKSKNGTLRVTGMEADIVHELSKKLNFVPYFAIARDGEAWGWLRPYPHGTVAEVYFKRCQIGVGHLTTTLDRYEALDVTVTVSSERECVTWAVPIGAAKSRPVWIEIYVNEFSGVMWGCMILVFGLIVCTYWGLAKRSGISYNHTPIYLFATFIFVPVKTPKAPQLRYLFISWVFYSFIIMISYQALVGSKLTVPYRQQDIETFGDLLKTNLRLLGYNSTSRIVADGASGDLKKLTTRMETTTIGVKEAIDLIIYDRNIAYLRESTTFKYFTTIHPQAKGQIHFMKDCPYQYYPVILLQNRSYLTRRANQVIFSLFESGILQKWHENYIHLYVHTPVQGIRLTITHMLAPFMALILGIISSIIVFILEQLLYRYGKLKKNCGKGITNQTVTSFQRNNFDL